jgi:hypothetical protein
MTRFALLLTVGSLLLGQTPQPQSSRPGAEYHAPSSTTPSARILLEIKHRQEALANLEALCDTIGPRLTGSSALVQAHDWAEAKLKSYGLTVLPREAYEFGPSWTRGIERARLLTHGRASLAVAQGAWSPATQGVLRAEVVYVDPGASEGALQELGSLRGKIVLVGSPEERKPGGEPSRAARLKLAEKVRTEAPAAVLLTSEKKDGILNMTGSPRPSRWVQFSTLPTGFLSVESASLLKRLLLKKEKVELELELGGTTGPRPVQAYNTLAELRGTEKPGEIVLLGAHMDSWDLGTGATDNGTGVVAVMEALRAIQAAGLKPKRTIRVVLFSGEEQGLLGSRAYVKAHAAELPRHQAVLIHDLGTGKVKGFALQNREDLRPFMAKAIVGLQELDVKDLPLEGSRDSDHAPFLGAGVPAFFSVQELADYFSATHHSQADTFEHVKAEELIQGASALAVTAWELATMKERLPHKALAGN